MEVTCVRNKLATKHVWLSIETHFGIFKDFLGFFAYLALNQNSHTQLCMNLKNHH